MYVNNSFANDYNNAYDPTHHQLHEGEGTRTSRLVTFFISIPLCLVAILVNLLLIFVILRYKALKTRANYYILNYCICHIIFLTSEHILHLAMDLFFGGYLEIQWYCTFIQLENYFLDMCIIFIAGYTFDEYIVMASSDYFLYMYKNGFKYVIGSVYPIHLILAFIVTNVCFTNTRDIKFHTSFIFVTIVYAICMAMLTKIRIDCRKTYYKNNICLVQALTISSYTILFFLPVVFYYNMLAIVEKIMTDDNLEILRTLAFIPEYMAYCATLILAYKLYQINKFFRLGISKIFCSSNSELDFSRLDIMQQPDIDKK